MKSECIKLKVDTLDEMFVRIFVFAACKEKREEKLRRVLGTGVEQVRRGWRWDLLTFTANCNNFVI
jgi:hypothetical protein